MSMVSLYDEADLRESAKPEVPAFSRSQLIREILAINTTVDPLFLDGFSEKRLKSYRDHLVWSQEPRQGSSPWSDPDATHSIGYTEPEE
ncbi:MAG: hypothetical protein HEQ23_05715 [Tepidisphaera sp.]|jgi:hypothetical protein